MDYRIGLDIGITSVGWSVLESDYKGEPKRIVDLGVRIFDAAEHPKDGASLAAPRRAARGTRRRLRRRSHRNQRLKQLFEDAGLIQQDNFAKRFETAGLPDVYKLRYEALERVLTGEELAQVLLHIAKHRGFQSNRRSEAKEGDNGIVLKAVSENAKLMEEKHYRTVGEMLYLDERFKMSADGEGNRVVLNTRNHGGKYSHTLTRALLVQEVETIFQRQRELGSSIAGEELEQKYLNIMQGQRSFDLGPGKPSPYGGNLIEKMVGYCTLEPKEHRAAKACYTAERFVMAQKLSHLRVRDGKGNLLELVDKLPDIVDMAYKSNKVTYANIRKSLGLTMEYTFSDLSYNEKKGKKTESWEEIVKRTEGATCISLRWFHEIRKALGGYDLNLLNSPKFVEYLDTIGNILTLYKNDDSRLQKLAEAGVPEEYREALLEVNPTKFQHLSLVAMKKLIPYLEQGDTYDKACENAGYDHKAQWDGEKLHLLKGPQIKELVDNITNPVVKRSVSQTFKVFNAIILKYGSPQSIHIELARDLAKNFDDRKKITKQRDENAKQNQQVKEQLKELGVDNPRDGDVLKFKLWKEQGECCMYSGKPIPFKHLFENKYAEIDHIIPYSKTFDNSYHNKVLVLAEENQNKGNRLPYEAFGKDTKKYENFVRNVESCVKDPVKRSHLLKQELTAEDIRAGKQRNINDTRYITSFVHDILVNYLEFAPYPVEGKIRKVIAVNGRVTNFLRVRWGLAKKDRSTDTHHAVDAVLVACCTQHMVQVITRNLQAKEIGHAVKLALYDEETGETFYRADYSDDAWIRKFGKNIPRPWTNFNDELDFRMNPEPQDFIRNFPKEYAKFDYPEGEEEKIRPIFVSRMPRHKVSGAERADTIRSPRHFEERGTVVSKVPLESLKLEKDGEIKDYYQPETDKLLYEALKARLTAFGGNAAEAFKEPFYKPKTDGSKGPMVRKVKVEEKVTLGVFVNGKKGIANNGDMIRVDVFRENGKYYFVPIYVADTRAKILPNKAVVAFKQCRDWKIMKDENFLFSLYPNDLFYFEHKQGMNGKTNEKMPCIINKQISYFKGADIATASFSGILHDSSVSFRGLGIQSLLEMKKYQVDVLGNVTEVKSEKRMYFHS